jgi:tRNA (guanine37-N1)-methyltransferase
VENQDPRAAVRILMTPQGRPLQQELAEELAGKERLLIIAGHYEGLDERVIDRLSPLEISIGDYVLSGGELPAMVLIDAVVRLIPGVLGHDESASHDSFSPGAGRLLDHPHYTRPPEWAGQKVPDVLLSGDHAAIERWRKEQARRRTSQRRPELLTDPQETT